ncbi:MAG: NigD-like protein [Prevotella sp.]|nr:NigD-like protein [Prevotella sp.]MDY5685860.1 NigD-like protein [Prevotella sp.]
MRKSRLLTAMLAVLMAATSFVACSDDNDWPLPFNVPNALVTVKPQPNGQQLLLQLDDSTTLAPVNMKSSPYGDKEVRALCNVTLTEQQTDKRRLNVYVNWIDSILTKPMAADLGDKNDETYGNAPIEIVRDWVTVAEDGYLTMRFRTGWGDDKPHVVNLVADNKDNPYELTFHHSGNTNGRSGDGLVAFRLDKLPDTNGKTVDVKLKWTSFSGQKSVTFKYCTRKSTNPDATSLLNIRPTAKIR